MRLSPPQHRLVKLQDAINAQPGEECQPLLSKFCTAQGASLSYAELDKRANQLAHQLIALGVGPEVPVGVMVPRSVEMVVALLGVLKAGGAYVPMDPDYPPDRLALMMEDSEVSMQEFPACLLLLANGVHRVKNLVLSECECSVAQAPVLLSLEKVHARVAIPTNAHVLLVSAASAKSCGQLCKRRSCNV